VVKCTEPHHKRPTFGTLNGMSRGIGETQQAILTLLSDDQRRTTRDLASELERSQRQIARAVRSLEQRGLVQVNWQGGTTPMSVGAPEAPFKHYVSAERNRIGGVDGKSYPGRKRYRVRWVDENGQERSAIFYSVKAAKQHLKSVARR
jgi:DNA-binding Lrp family transcriptional regulator